MPRQKKEDTKKTFIYHHDTQHTTKHFQSPLATIPYGTSTALLSRRSITTLHSLAKAILKRLTFLFPLFTMDDLLALFDENPPEESADDEQVVSSPPLHHNDTVRGRQG